ncbi:hypothetical protein THRCLA_02101 [Thraustotheca clavata]|uniref:Prolyl 4-hydroxylase alpha subunit domain-containing protein n=1 Tax=Thraustotheca clavata TaxID=74557 RepID=A0A1W0A697_9STRA|nr:hypothetical protein THRCLA_02101 [Thraustotheca clavata]
MAATIGILTLPGNTTYYGQLNQERKPHGCGCIYFSNGGYYAGEFDNGQKHGYGVQSYPNGSRYGGSFVNNEREGYGIYLIATGVRYRGQWLQSTQHGIGELMESSCEVKCGLFENNRFSTMLDISEDVLKEIQASMESQQQAILAERAARVNERTAYFQETMTINGWYIQNESDLAAFEEETNRKNEAVNAEWQKNIREIEQDTQEGKTEEATLGETQKQLYLTIQQRRQELARISMYWDIALEKERALTEAKHISAYAIVAYFFYLVYMWTSIEFYPVGQSLLDTPPVPAPEQLCSLSFKVDSGVELSVQKASNVAIAMNQIFVMKNGENSGRFISWTGIGDDNCVLSLAITGAKVLGCDTTEPPKVYNDMGYSLTSWKDVESAKFVHILLHNQVWVWPGIAIGYSWYVDGILMKTLSMSPKVILVTDFLSDEECSAIIGGQELLGPSGIVNHDGKMPQKIRTSSTAFIGNLPVAPVIKQRAAKLARLPSASYVENIQLVRYNPGQWFRQHTDYFQHLTLDADRRAGVSFSHWIKWIQREARSTQLHPSHPLYPSHTPEFELTLAKLLDKSKNEMNEQWRRWLKHQIELQSDYIISSLLDAFNKLDMLVHLRELWEQAVQIPSLKWTSPIEKNYIEPNRHATLFLYLNNLTEGGETVFPYATNSDRASVVPTGMPECSLGLQVKPIKRAGALFYNKKPTGENDPLSTHGGCPPVNDTKWGSNVFMWNVDAMYGSKKWKFW